MKSRISLAYVAASAALALGLFSTQVESRGGGGGGGGGRGGGVFARGGYGGGGGYGGLDRGFDSGFDNRAGDYYRGDGARAGDGIERLNNGIGGSEDRPDAFNSSPRPAEQDLLSGADREYNVPKTLPTDGGFGHVSMSANASRTIRYTSSDLASHGNLVRGAYHNNDVYNRGWWDAHPNAWRYPGYDRDWGYGYVGWDGLYGFWGMPENTVLPDYDYGSNITYENNEVYYGSTPACSADTYYTQAQSLAQQAPPYVAPTATPATSTTVAATTSKSKDADTWKSLGVFALTQGGQTSSTSLFQLAIDKNGIVRGNYTNQLTGEVNPVHGALDKKIMRVAWTVGDNSTTVYDTGMKNLLQKQSTILVHLSKDNTQEFTLVRLDKPKATTSKT